MVMKENGRSKGTEGTQERNVLWGPRDVPWGLVLGPGPEDTEAGELGTLDQTQMCGALRLPGPGARAVKGSRSGSVYVRTGQIAVIGFLFLQLFGGSKIVSK